MTQDEVFSKLGSGASSSANKKLEKLRGILSTDYEDLIPRLSLHTFRAVTDGHFVAENLIKELSNSEFAKVLIARGIRIVIGETDNEAWKYSILNTPTSIPDLKIQVQNYYPAGVVEPLFKIYPLYKLDPSSEDFQEQLRIVFGDITDITADIQI